MDQNQVILDLQGITKRFPGVLALDDVSFQCTRGEVHALVGENGAGKSTLVKILAGVHQADQGTITLRGQLSTFHSPHEAQQAGIAVIYQEFNLLPELTVAENIVLGREPASKVGFVKESTVRTLTLDVLSRLGIQLDIHEKIAELSIAEQQLIEIAKALVLNADIIIMDEPSAALARHELENLFRVVRSLQDQGVTIIFISHRLEEVFEIAQRVTVLKDGQLVGTYSIDEITRSDLVRMMVGRSLDETFPEGGPAREDIVLSVHNLNRPDHLFDVSFQLRAGEILGVAGLVGAGRTELARALFGADPDISGEVCLIGEPIRIVDPHRAIRAGIIMVPEDRKEQGLVLQLSVAKNITLSILQWLTKALMLNKEREEQTVKQMIDSLNIRTSSPAQEVQFLSGGNQQKVVLAKYLATRPVVVILDEPTRGIDVGAKLEVYNLIRDLAKQGAAVLLISSELPEILGMADRILVMSRGRVTGELTRDQASEEALMALATS